MVNVERMSRQVSHDVLRRMVSPPPPAPEDVPITSSRAMRLAVTRAADQAHQLPVTILGLSEEVLDLDAMLAALSPDAMLIGMVQGDILSGLATFDLQLRAALIEAQTIGMVLPSAPEDRPATGTDAIMAVPLLERILDQMTETTSRTPLDGWGVGLHPAGQVPNLRAAGLILPERAYRVIRMSVDLQVEGREGVLTLALPDHESAPPLTATPKEDGDWSTRFRATVNAAPVHLQAELHRFKVPLFVVEDLAVGQVLPLVGCRVTSVKLKATDGRKVATARLGQSGGMRAVRVEQAVTPDMRDLDQFGAEDSHDLPLMTEDADFAAPAMDMTAGDVGFAMPVGGEDEMALAVDETAEMLDEMEAALAADTGAPEDDAEEAWDLNTAEAAPLDWSEEGFDLPEEG